MLKLVGNCRSSYINKVENQSTKLLHKIFGIKIEKYPEYKYSFI